jgi:hypothetical protein
VFITLPNSLQRRAISNRTARLKPHRQSAFRPRLAVLEDRCLLSTLTVTSSADDVTQNHTLRYAVAHAQSGDRIQLTAAIKSPIVLTQGELVLSRDVTIESVPARTPTISGNGISRVFEISAGAHVSLTNLNLIGGNGVAANPGGSAGYDGLGGAILNLGALTVDGVEFLNNTASVGGGGIFTFPLSSTTITDSVLSGDKAGFGGGISNAGQLTITGSTLSGNFALNYNGGGLDTIGNVVIAHTVFQGNNAAGFGGGFANRSPGTVVVSASSFLGNTAGSNGGNGGGFDNNSGVVTLSDSLVDGNYSYGYGGGMGNDGTLTVKNSTISNNTAVGNAGGIFNYFTTGTIPSKMDLTGTIIAGNTSLFGYGGGVSTWGTSTITGGSIHGNKAYYGGGAIDNYVGSLAISGTSIADNAAVYYSSYGGGIDSNFATLAVSNSTISGNMANFGGGGVYGYHSTVTISGSTISGNMAAFGGGIYNDYGDFATITGSTLAGNSAGYYGGGIYNASYLTVTGSTLAGNSANYGGGIFIDFYSVATITGSTLAGNSATYGGGIDNYGYNLSVGTSTFSGNTPDSILGGYLDLGGNTF